MTGFFDGDTKTFTNFFEIAPKFFSFFLKINFVLKQTFSEKISLQNGNFCVGNVVLDIRNWIFFHQCLVIYKIKF